MTIASAICFVMGLACPGDFHEAVIMGVGHLALAECCRRACGSRG